MCVTVKKVMILKEDNQMSFLIAFVFDLGIFVRLTHGGYKTVRAAAAVHLVVAHAFYTHVHHPSMWLHSIAITLHPSHQLIYLVF